MYTKAVALALVLSSAASAAPSLRSRHGQGVDACQDSYKACIAAGTPKVACACTLTACVGEDNARNREFCASATANLPKPTTTNGIPGGCNPAHPGSCPSSYFLTSTKAPAATPTSVPGIPGGCNPAHPGSCPTSTVAAPVASVAPGSNPKLVSPAKSWTVANLTRYCGDGNTGCDYNFAVVADGKTERCTVIRMPGANAATESWSNQKCTARSDLSISWGYAPKPAPAFAVITVVKGKELAWFGVPDINGGKVTPNSPFGSGQYGTLPASPVYTYN